MSTQRSIEPATQIVPQINHSAQAEQTRQLRKRCWRVALLLEPVCIPLCGLAARTLSAPGRPVVALRAMQQAADELRRITHASRVRAHEQARESASGALADADVDDRLLDRVIADLTSHQAGDGDSLRTWIDPSAIDPALWTAYVSAVLATHRALWMARQDVA